VQKELESMSFEGVPCECGGHLDVYQINFVKFIESVEFQCDQCHQTAVWTAPDDDDYNLTQQNQ